MKSYDSSLQENLLEEHFRSRWGRFAKIVTHLNRNRIYIPCLEVPITTYCTLCCKECANLIQYYSNPYHVSFDTLIESIGNICGVVDSIDCIRFLGGEPFLHPKLNLLLNAIEKQKKIKYIVLVTNGTVLLSESTLRLLSMNPQIRISISKYPCANEKRERLIKQLDEYGVNYVVRDVIWKAKANTSCRNKNRNELMESFAKCPNRFFSLLNGKLFLCPRASHGTDLGIIPAGGDEYVDCLDHHKLEERILQLFRRSYLTACNYCYEDVSDFLPIVPAGIQIKKSDAIKIYQTM